MAKPLDTSFTLRPSKHDKQRAELTLRKQDVALLPRTPLRCHCQNTSSNNNRELKQYQPFKRQRLFMDRAGLAKPPAAFVGSPATLHRRYPSTLHRHSDDVDSPLLQRLPMEFEPPRDEDYWKNRCFRMRDRCIESQLRIREMEEDQRQLRRRILKLEEQLLIQSSNMHQFARPICTETSPGRASGCIKHNSTVGGSRDAESEVGDKTFALSELGPSQPTSSRDCCDRNKVVTEASASRAISMTESSLPPPTRVVAVPRDSTKSVLASCFYLTDGEGFSDSDYDYDYMADDDEDDDRNDSGSHRRDDSW